MNGNITLRNKNVAQRELGMEIAQNLVRRWNQVQVSNLQSVFFFDRVQS